MAAAPPLQPSLRRNAAGAPMHREAASLGLRPPVLNGGVWASPESPSRALRMRIARPCPAALMATGGEFSRVRVTVWAGLQYHGGFHRLGPAPLACQSPGCTRVLLPGPQQLCSLCAVREGLLAGGCESFQPAPAGPALHPRSTAFALTPSPSISPLRTYPSLLCAQTSAPAPCRATARWRSAPF
jgi:hypothetical protein